MIKMYVYLGSNRLNCCIIDTNTKEKLYEKDCYYSLIESLDVNGNISSFKISEIINNIQQFINITQKINYLDVLAIGTPSLRIICNLDELLNQIYDKIGIKVKILNILEETQLIWKGALFSFNDANNKKFQTYIVININDEITEISYGVKSRIIKSFAVPIGTDLLNKMIVSNKIINNDDVYFYYYLDKIFKNYLIALFPYIYDDTICILTSFSEFLPITVSKSQTHVNIINKNLSIISSNMVFDILNDMIDQKEHFYNKNEKIEEMSLLYILHYLSYRLNIKKVYHSALGLIHGLILEKHN